MTLNKRNRLPGLSGVISMYFAILMLAIPSLSFAASQASSGLSNHQSASITTKTDAQMKHGRQGLFALLADKGSITRINREKQPLRLTLSGVHAAVVFFTDRPQRQAQSIAIGNFIAKWDSMGFTQIPPNAVLENVHIDAQGKQIKASSTSNVIELTHPHYDAKKSKLTFIIKPIRADNVSMPKPGRFDYPSLFIDGTCWGCM